MKTHDLVIKTGTYTDAQGEQKARWQNVGAVIKTEKGTVLLMEKWFNPAGVKDDRDSESVLIQVMPVDRERKPAPVQFSDAPF